MGVITDIGFELHMKSYFKNRNKYSASFGMTEKSIYRVPNIHIKILFGSIQAWLRRKRLKLELSTKSCRYKKLFRFVSSPLFLLSKRYMNLAGWCADRLAGVEKWDTKMVGEIFNKQLCFYCVQRHRKNCARKRERERERQRDQSWCARTRLSLLTFLS